MSDVTWDLSLREAGQGSDTTLSAEGVTDGAPDLRVGSQQTVVLDFSRSRSAFETATKLLEFAHTGAQGTDADGIAWYREKLPSSAPVDSQVVQIVPSTDVSSFSYPGVWAIVTGGEPQRRTFAPRLELGLFVLAEDSDYADRSAVETALGEVL